MSLRRLSGVLLKTGQRGVERLRRRLRVLVLLSPGLHLLFLRVLFLSLRLLLATFVFVIFDSKSNLLRLSVAGLPIFRLLRKLLVASHSLKRRSWTNVTLS